MKNITFSKSLSLAAGLSILAGTALADSQVNHLFLPSNTPAETITVAFKGKPPYHNRQQVRAQRRAQETARAEIENLEKTELSALEIDVNSEEPPVNKKSSRKKYGHPYHR